jgi:hypothetical protein
MAEKDFTLEESDFDEAILEIAEEIERINKLKIFTQPKNEPLAELKTEITIKKVESISNNIFQMLKTIEEIQISSNEDQSPQSFLSEIPQAAQIFFTKGLDQKYHSITVNEYAIEKNPVQLKNDISLENIIKDSEFNSNNKETHLDINIAEEGSRLLSERNEKIDQSIEHPISVKSEPHDTNDKITSDMIKQMKIKEQMIFKNFVKMYKKY